jgi:hypothetical protein
MPTNTYRYAWLAKIALQPLAVPLALCVLSACSGGTGSSSTSGQDLSGALRDGDAGGRHDEDADVDHEDGGAEHHRGADSGGHGPN